MRLKPTCALCITAVTLAALPTDGLTAQTGSVDFSVARWWRQGPGVATIYSGTYRTRLLGPSWWGLAAVHTKDDGALVDMTTSGGEASLALGLPQRGPYALAPWASVSVMAAPTLGQIGASVRVIHFTSFRF